MPRNNGARRGKNQLHGSCVHLFPLVMALFCGFMLNSCEGTSFQGSDGSPKEQAAGATPTPSLSPPAVGPPAESSPKPVTGASIPANCDAKVGATQAVLRTATVLNGIFGNFIEYEVFLTDCLGMRRTLTADTIYFDWNGASTSFRAPLVYKMTSQDQQISGTMLAVAGADLFGKTGAEYAYYRSDKPVTFTTNANSFILRIELGGAKIEPLSGPTNSLATFLRLGSAAPVQSNVGLIF